MELFQGVARRVSDLLQRPVVSYANGRDIVITFGQEEAPALVLRSPGWASRVGPHAANLSWLNRLEAQLTALRYFALDGTDHRADQGMPQPESACVSTCPRAGLFPGSDDGTGHRLRIIPPDAADSYIFIFCGSP